MCVCVERERGRGRNKFCDKGSHTFVMGRVRICVTLLAFYTSFILLFPESRDDLQKMQWTA